MCSERGKLFVLSVNSLSFQSPLQTIIFSHPSVLISWLVGPMLRVYNKGSSYNVFSSVYMFSLCLGEPFLFKLLHMIY